MADRFTTDNLIVGVQERVSIPTNQVLLQSASLIRFCDRAIQSYLIPILVSLNQNFFLRRLTLPTINGQHEYRIPDRLVGRTTTDLKLNDGADNIRDIALVTVEDNHRFVDGTPPHSFHFMRDTIRMIPAPTSDDMLIEFWASVAPNRLILTTDAAQVTAISGGDITVNNVPSSLVIGAEVDFLQGISGYDFKNIDKAITNVNGSIISFATADVPSDLEIGDWIAPARESPVVQLPDECQPYLETLIARRVMLAVGDFETANELGKDEREEKDNLLKLLEPRIRTEPTKIINRTGLLKANRARYRRGIIY